MAENDTGEAIPNRRDVPLEHCWDLSELFASESLWEEGLVQLEGKIDAIEGFRGTLGESPEQLLACLEFNNATGLLAERLGSYAQLRTAEDGSDSTNQGRFSRYMNVAVRLEAAMSYQVPEIQGIADDVMDRFLESDALSAFRIYLKKLLRHKPHILSEKEERLLAMQAEFSRTARTVFSSLSDVDMDFGLIDTPDGKRPLTQSTYGAYMIHPNRDVRRRAYLGLHNGFEAHKHSLAGLYNGSVQLDIYHRQGEENTRQPEPMPCSPMMCPSASMTALSNRCTTTSIPFRTTTRFAEKHYISRSFVCMIPVFLS